MTLLAYHWKGLWLEWRLFLLTPLTIVLSHSSSFPPQNQWYLLMRFHGPYSLVSQYVCAQCWLHNGKDLWDVTLLLSWNWCPNRDRSCSRKREKQFFRNGIFYTGTMWKYFPCIFTSIWGLIHLVCKHEYEPHREKNP